MGFLLCSIVMRIQSPHWDGSLFWTLPSIVVHLTFSHLVKLLAPYSECWLLQMRYIAWFWYDLVGVISFWHVLTLSCQNQEINETTQGDEQHSSQLAMGCQRQSRGIWPGSCLYMDGGTTDVHALCSEITWVWDTRDAWWCCILCHMSISTWPIWPFNGDNDDKP